MLNKLSIKNFIIIDNLDISFNKGFNVITGDTGAGKSIIIDALNIIKGITKFEQNYIKVDTNCSSIEAEFLIENDNHIKCLLNKLNIKYDKYFTIYRSIDKNSQSKILINNKSVKLSVLNNLLIYHLDIVNQKDTDKILIDKNHINILDQYINNDKLLSETNNLYQEYNKYTKEHDKIINDLKDENYVDYLMSQIDEIEQLNLLTNEDVLLNEQELKYKELEKNNKLYYEALSLFQNNDGIDTLIYKLKNILINENEFYESINDINIKILDIMDRLKTLVSINKIDYQDYNNIQERLYKLNSVKKKYGSINKAIDYKNTLISKVDILKNKDIVLKELNEKIEVSHKAFKEKSLLLHNDRVKYAKEFEEYINEQLDKLLLNNSKFRINITKSDESSNGYDKVVFEIATNGSQNYSSINKILSGGEYSRIMIVIKEMLNDLFNLKCVVFDEIDTGIDGAVATKIGQKLYDISTNRQLFVITHLPIVASFADYHYHVFKSNNLTNIKLLNDKEIIDQLAFMNFSDVNIEAINATKKLYEVNQYYHSNFCL